MWTIFKVFIEFVIVLPLFYILLFWCQGMWDLNSPKSNPHPLYWKVRSKPLDHRASPTHLLFVASCKTTGWYHHQHIDIDAVNMPPQVPSCCTFIVIPIPSSWFSNFWFWNNDRLISCKKSAKRSLIPITLIPAPPHGDILYNYNILWKPDSL